MKFRLILVIFLCSLACSLDAAYVLRNGKLINTKDLATLPVEEHYNLGINALQKKDWEEAIHQFRIVTINFPLSSWGKESFYYLGVAYFHDGDKDLANQNLSDYLKETKTPSTLKRAFATNLLSQTPLKMARNDTFGAMKTCLPGFPIRTWLLPSTMR